MISEVAPHPGPSGNRTPWVESARLSLTADQVVVAGPHDQHVSLPLRGDLAAAALVFTRTDTLDQYGGVFNETLLFVTRRREVLCTVPGKGWDKGELTDFAHAAGLDFRSETFASYLKQSAAYPRVPSVVDVRESSRSFRALALILGLGVPLAVALVILFLVNG